MIETQILKYYQNRKLVEEYAVSTAKNGTGTVFNSFCTPLGHHKIGEKIGGGAALGAVFVARRPTGEIYSRKLGEKFPERDWILTRILWLEGCENFNQNTKSRHIYIHGAPDDAAMGVPASKGCIRMRNSDIVELFEKVRTGDEVMIKK